MRINVKLRKYIDYRYIGEVILIMGDSSWLAKNTVTSDLRDSDVQKIKSLVYKDSQVKNGLDNLL